jgi:hypothetical protein
MLFFRNLLRTAADRRVPPGEPSRDNFNTTFLNFVKDTACEKIQFGRSQICDVVISTRRPLSLRSRREREREIERERVGGW